MRSTGCGIHPVQSDGSVLAGARVAGFAGSVRCEMSR